MKNRNVQYAVWIIGTVVLVGAVFALVLAQIIPALGGIGIGVFWVWTGFLMMMDWCPEWRQWDRWGRQVYGLAFAWMGGAAIAISLVTKPSNVRLFVALTFVPSVLIALIGRLWYVEKKRSEEWKKQNQTEKD